MCRKGNWVSGGTLALNGTKNGTIKRKTNSSVSSISPFDTLWSNERSDCVIPGEIGHRRNSRIEHKRCIFNKLHSIIYTDYAYIRYIYKSLNTNMPILWTFLSSTIFNTTIRTILCKFIF